MIDENEIFSLLISVQENDGNILLRFDEDILNQNKNEDCILLIELFGCEEYLTKVNELKSAIGNSIDYHPNDNNGKEKKVSFMNMDTLEQIEIICYQVKESKTKISINDLIFRCEILSKLLLDYKKSYDKLSVITNKSFEKILKHIENEINILQQKESFFKEVDSEKYFIVKGKLVAHKDILSIIKAAT